MNAWNWSACLSCDCIGWVSIGLTRYIFFVGKVVDIFIDNSGDKLLRSCLLWSYIKIQGFPNTMGKPQLGQTNLFAYHCRPYGILIRSLKMDAVGPRHSERFGLWHTLYHYTVLTVPTHRVYAIVMYSIYTVYTQYTYTCVLLFIRWLVFPMIEKLSGILTLRAPISFPPFASM